MPIDYQSRVEDDYLHIVAKGSVCSMDELLNYIQRIYEDLVRADLFKVLADETKCHMHMSLDGLKDATKEFTEPKGFDVTKRKSAILCSAMNHRLLRHTFDSKDGIKIFTDETEAREWLAKG